MVDNYTTESYSQAFDGTRIQLYDDVEGSFMEEFDIGNINTDILKKTLAAESKTEPKTAPETETKQEPKTSPESKSEPKSSPESKTAPSDDDSNLPINTRLDNIKDKYQDLLNQYESYVKNKNTQVQQMENDTSDQLAFQDSYINKSTNQLEMDKMGVETTIQKIRARISQITQYKKTLNILKWTIYGLCGLAVVVLFIYIYKRVYPKKSSTLPVVSPKATLRNMLPTSTPKPAVTPATKPTTMPGSKPTTMPGSKPATMPGSKPATMPGSKPTTMPATKPVTMPGSKPAATPKPKLETSKPLVNPGRRQKLDNMTTEMLKKGGKVVCPKHS